MRLKSGIYQEQQKQIKNELIDILKLNENNYIILHELDENKELQEQIVDLIPKI